MRLKFGCLVDKPENFFDGDPVKACNAVLKVWEGNYEKAVAALPAVSTLKCEKNEPYKYVSGKLRPDGKPGFNTPTGKLELFSTITSKYGLEGLPVYKEMMKPEGDFNLRLINGTRKPYITHSKTRSDAPYLLELEPVSTIHMNPADAKKRGLVTGRLRRNAQQVRRSRPRKDRRLDHRARRHDRLAVRLARRPEHPESHPAPVGSDFGLRAVFRSQRERCQGQVRRLQ